nr:PH domain-containing protein [Pigmentibacter ruber]
MAFNYKTASKEERQNEFNRIAKITGDNQIHTKKELHYLPEILRDDEELLAFSSGFMDGNSWLIALTDRRIIFLDKGMIYGLKQSFIDIDKINSISCSSGILFGDIIVTDGAVQRNISYVEKHTVKLFTNKVQEVIDSRKKTKEDNKYNFNQGSIIEQLEKLAALKDKGILTLSEFENQKQKLLNL